MAKPLRPRRLMALLMVTLGGGPAGVTSFVQPSFEQPTSKSSTSSTSSTHTSSTRRGTHSRWAGQPRLSERPNARSGSPLYAATADDLLAQAAALRKEADEAQAEVEQEKKDSYMAEVVASFKQADLNADGVVTIAELQHWLETRIKLKECKITAEWAAQLVKDLDTSGNANVKGLAVSDFMTASEFETRVKEIARLEAITQAKALKEKEAAELEEKRESLEAIIDASIQKKSGGGFFDNQNEYAAFAWNVVLPIGFVINITNKFIIPLIQELINGKGGGSPFDGI